MSYYFDQAAKSGKEVEFIYKSHDIPPGVGMRDIEDGNLTGLQYDPWMTDINMAKHQYYPSPWFYNPKNEIKSADLLTDVIVDGMITVPSHPSGFEYAALIGTSTVVGKEAAGVSFTSLPGFAPGVRPDPVGVLRILPPGPSFPHEAGETSNMIAPSMNRFSSQWLLEDRSQFTTNFVVPEPSPVAIWSVLAGIGFVTGCWQRRRKRIA